MTQRCQSSLDSEWAWELIEHADDHLRKNSPRDTRIAFLSVDRAVRVIIATFLRHPKSVSRIRAPKEKDVRGATRSFLSLVEMLHRTSPTHLSASEVTLLAKFHRIRNVLAYESASLQIRRSDAVEFFHLAIALAERLFDQSPQGQSLNAAETSKPLTMTSEASRLGLVASEKRSNVRAIAKEAFADLERAVVSCAMAEGFAGNDFFRSIQFLQERSSVSSETASNIALALNHRNMIWAGIIPQGLGGIDEFVGNVAHLCQFFATGGAHFATPMREAS